MSENRQVGPSQFMFAASLGAGVTGSTLDVRDASEICLQLVFTGTPTGTFAVQGSLDQTNWVSATLTPSPAAAGAGDTILIELIENSMPYIRVTYTRTSGTGSVDGFIFAKGP